MASQAREGFVPDQDGSAQTNDPDLRTTVQSLLQANLSDQALREQLLALLAAPQGAMPQPTTDDATDHPGYQ